MHVMSVIRSGRHLDRRAQRRLEGDVIILRPRQISVMVRDWPAAHATRMPPQSTSMLAGLWPSACHRLGTTAHVVASIRCEAHQLGSQFPQSLRLGLLKMSLPRCKCRWQVGRRAQQPLRVRVDCRRECAAILVNDVCKQGLCS